MHLVVSTYPYFFLVVSHPNKILPLKEFKQEPQNRLFLLLTAIPYPLLPLTYDPLLLYWLGTSWWCLDLARAPVLCTFKACPLLMHLPWSGGSSVHFTAHPWPFTVWTAFWFLISLWLAVLKGRALFAYGLFFLQPTPFVVLLPFLPCYSTIPVVVSFDPSLLGLF